MQQGPLTRALLFFDTGQNDAGARQGDFLKKCARIKGVSSMTPVIDSVR
jgi:hypothetical protein